MDVSHAVLVVLGFLSRHRQRRPPVEPLSAHQLCFQVPQAHPLAPRSTRALSFPLFHSLCLGDSVFVRIHPCFSRQGSLNDRSDSFSAFVIMWLCRSYMRCKRCTAWAASSVSVSFNVRRQNVESSAFNLSRPFNNKPWQSAPSLSAGTFFVNFHSGATICHGVPHKPAKFVDSQASLSVCLVQLLPRTTPFLVMRKTAPVRS